ncbi:hypothetical protein MNBD_NITROSPINAE02-1172 [hydrothermal vent metagenome]|uniref:Uncharacterized protein n=1 Tax=hydrothermal vent metagenome TaxID=652676 RepID=A0A3B1CL83_9ZZZZ
MASLFSSRFLRPIFVPFALLFILVLAAGCSDEGGVSFMQKSDSGRSGSKFLVVDKADIVVDKETGLQVAKNVINVTLSKSAKDEAIKKIVSSVKGEIVGYDYSVNFFQIRIPNADLATIKKERLNLLANFKEVEAASICPVSVHKNPFYIR